MAQSCGNNRIVQELKSPVLIRQWRLAHAPQPLSSPVPAAATTTPMVAQLLKHALVGRTRRQLLVQLGSHLIPLVRLHHLHCQQSSLCRTPCAWHLVHTLITLPATANGAQVPGHNAVGRIGNR